MQGSLHQLPGMELAVAYVFLSYNLYYLFMQVSLAPVGEDKFSKLLHTCHNTLAALLEVNV